MAIIKNINAEKIQGRLDVTDVSASYLKVTNDIVASTINANLDYSNVTNKPTLVSGSSQINFNLISNKPIGLVSGSGQIASEISGSFNIVSASLASRISNISTDFADIQNKPTLISSSRQIASEISGSFIRLSGSIETRFEALEGKDLSFATTGSNQFKGAQTITGSLTFHRTTDPDIYGTTTTATHLYVSASNNLTGEDLYYRQQDNRVKWKWLEGKLNSGILWGGDLSYNGANIYVKKGSGIIVNHRAGSTHEISPLTTYVLWNDITGSITDIATSSATYVGITSSGSLYQQKEFFTPNQYRNSIPLGLFNHTGKNVITSVANNVVTAYDDVNQTSNFIQAFGPLKLDGLSIIPTGSLSINVEAGSSFILGGFHQQDPNDASHKTTPLIQRAQIARVRKDGNGGFTVDNNNGSFYTTLDTDYWDDGTGTLNTISTGDWQIQRVFFNPFTSRVHIYYGSTLYTSLINAKQYLATDPFTEAPYSSHQYVFIGYLIIKGQTSDLQDTTKNAIVQSGLFRNTVGSSGGAQSLLGLHDLNDVEVASPSNGDLLAYNSTTEVWSHTKELQGTYIITGSLIVTGNITGSTDFNTLLNKPTLLSGSRQIASEISGSFTSLSGSIATRFEVNEGKFATTGSNTFNGDQTINGDLTVNGKLTATSFNNIFVSSSTVYTSGSTKFGDTYDDNHEFTGSLKLAGGLNVEYGINANWFHGDVDFIHLINTPRFVSSSVQIGSEISGSFTLVSASFANTISNLGGIYATDLELGNVSSSLALRITDLDGIYASDIEVASLSGSIANDITYIRNNFAFASSVNSISQSFAHTIGNLDFIYATDTDLLGVSSSLAGRFDALSTDFSAITNKPTLLSGSAQIASEISGSFTAVSASFANTISNLGNIYATDLELSNVSASLATTISNISTDWPDITNKPSGIVSSSLQLYNNTLVGMVISGSFSGSYRGDGSGLTGVQTTVVQNATAYDTFTGVTSKTISHNFGTKNVIVSVYDNNDAVVIPKSIITTNDNTVTLGFDYATTGRAVVAKGGHIVSGSLQDYTYREAITGSSSYTITHNLNEDFPVVQVYDTIKEQVIPAKVKSTSTNAVLIEFINSFSGTVVVKK